MQKKRRVREAVEGGAGIIIGAKGGLRAGDGSRVEEWKYLGSRLTSTSASTSSAAVAAGPQEAERGGEDGEEDGEAAVEARRLRGGEDGGGWREGVVEGVGERRGGGEGEGEGERKRRGSGVKGNCGFPARPRPGAAKVTVCLGRIRPRASRPTLPRPRRLILALHMAKTRAVGPGRARQSSLSVWPARRPPSSLRHSLPSPSG